MFEYNKPTILNTLWKRTLLYFLLFFILSAVQINFLDIIKIYDFIPDILLILIVWITLREGVYFGLIMAFFAGVIHDSIALNPYGLTALCYIIPAFVLKFFKSKENYQKDLFTLRFLVFTFISTLLSSFLKVLLTMNIFTEDIEIYFVQQILGISIYTSIIALFPILINLRPRRY